MNKYDFLALEVLFFLKVLNEFSCALVLFSIFSPRFCEKDFAIYSYFDSKFIKLEF